MKNKLAQNISMLYIMNIAKLIFPILTLPYLTRVLTVEAYGVVAYVKSCMAYVQLIIDFAFNLSVTKSIIDAKDKKGQEQIIGQAVLAKMLLALVSFVVLIFMIVFIPILRENALFTMLSFCAIALTCFLVDFYFSAIEKMQVITMRFVAAKAVSTTLTFIFVKSDANLLWIPILDIIGNAVAVTLTWTELKKHGFDLKIKGIKKSLILIKESSMYFWSNMATTAFGALNTMLIGIFCKSSEVAYWSVAMQLIGAIQSMYTPIINGVYPRMLNEKNFKIIKNLLKVFMPVIIVGCIICVVFADFILAIVGGEQYRQAVHVFRALIPILLISFPAMLFGWPVLGTINKVKETTLTTIMTAVFQVAGLIVLGFTGNFTLINIAILRGITELLLFTLRFRYFWKYRKEFNLYLNEVSDRKER